MSAAQPRGLDLDSAHALYKAGILDQGRIRIESMRSEGPFG
jgi:hypothetical protein